MQPIANYVQLISRYPEPEMIKKGDGYFYIPKSILQKELCIIYAGHTQWEMQRDSVNNSGMWGVGILKVKHPVSGEWLSYSGTAAMGFKSVMKLDYPLLEAQCFKNACKKIGVWFGQTLNIELEDMEPSNFNNDNTPTNHNDNSAIRNTIKTISKAR